MEALVAIGLAGNVAQFTQFAGSLISKTVEIRKAGSPSSLKEVLKNTQSVNQQARIIEAHLASHQVTLTQEERLLLGTARDCLATGTEFEKYLETFILQSGSQNVVRSARASLKFHWSQHKLDAFALNLDRLRSSLMLATSFALRSNTATIHDKLIAHIEASESAFDLQSRENAQVITSMRALLQATDSAVASRFDALQLRTEACLKEIQTLREGMIEHTEYAILAWLNFGHRRWRYEAVPLAYKKTFEWIFSDGGELQSWHNFRSFLKDDSVNTPYFICGKAGSGKSTLMKFIVDHDATTSLLKEWAKTKELIILKFFFWNPGTDMQKSSVGMLRTLLHSVLVRYPELLPRVFPHLYEDKDDVFTTVEPTYQELKNALEILQQCTADSFRLCIFIDGIDELEGDHKDLSIFLRRLSSPNVKVVASSRPINACLHAFARCPTLRLQDLTLNDMAIFIDEELCSHFLMSGLQRRHPNAVEDMVNELKERAEGVFLWVTLVVRILTDGLEDGDGIELLSEKLRSLPSGLRELYERMFERLQPEYQVEAAQIFQLHRVWTDHIESPFRAELLSLALEKPWLTPESSKPYVEGADLDWITQTIGARIRSRCCGLLELRQKGTATVEYLHRTAADFTKHPDIWDKICSTTASSGLDSTDNLVRACLWMIKGCYNIRDIKFRPHLRYAVLLLRYPGSMSDSQYMAAVEELDRTMEWMFLHNELPYMQAGSSQPRHGTSVHWSLRLQDSKREWLVEGMENYASLLTFATVNGLTRYLDICNHRQQISPDVRPMLVLYALLQWKRNAGHRTQITPYMPRVELGLHDHANILEYLLRNVAGPESTVLDTKLFDVATKLENSLALPQWVCTLQALFLGTAPSPRQLYSTTEETFHSCVRKLNTLEDPGIQPRRQLVVQKLGELADLEVPSVILLEQTLSALELSEVWK